jgi:hypothetical protein
MRYEAATVLWRLDAKQRLANQYRNLACPAHKAQRNESVGEKHKVAVENVALQNTLLARRPSVTDLGITGELARCLTTTNVIESPNSVVRRVSGRVTNYKDAEMALRWSAAGFLEAEKSFKKLRGHVDLKILINSLRPAPQQLKKAA